MGKLKYPSRVLFISPQPFFEWRGSPIRVKFNVLALSELGYHVDLLTLPIGHEESVGDVTIIRAWNLFNSNTISIGPSLLKLWFDLILIIQGATLVTRNRYDIIHGNEEAGFICYILSFLCRTKCIFEKHSDANSYHPSLIMRPILAIYGAVEKLTVRRCDAVISTGPALDEQAQSWLKNNASNHKFSMIPDIPSSLHEADSNTTAKVRATLIDEDNHVIITYAGSFAPYQGVDIIFDSIPHILKNTPSARFVIIGGSDKEIAFYTKQLKAQGVGADKEVQFLGKISPDKLSDYLAASDILLAPRKSGINSPLKILDYFKAGGAIIATDTVANRRLLNEKNAVMCEFNIECFSKVTSSLVNAPEKRKTLGREAYKLYQSTYNFTTFKHKIDDAYKTVLAN
jgi:glycosyltransferase involved in cell wall biosynthesis